MAGLQPNAVPRKSPDAREDQPGRRVNERRRSVAHLTSVHDYWDHRIFSKECRSLAAAGYEVTLVAPGTFNGVIDGVRVVAVPRAARRATRFVRTTSHVLRAALRIDARIYHFHDPELIFAGLVLKLFGRRVIYDVHEDLTKTVLRKRWLPRPVWAVRRWVAAITGAVERLAVATFDATVLVVPMPHRRFAEQRTILVRNYPVLDEFDRSRTRYGDRAPLVVYVGGVAVSRGATDMVAAMDMAGADTDVRLIVAGWFQPRQLQQDLTRGPGAARVTFLGERRREEVIDLLGRARIGLCVLRDAPGYAESYPVKLFEYMAAGLPVVASDFPAWRRIIEDSGCGLLVEPARPDLLAKAIVHLLRHPEDARAMGERGRKAVEERYQWAHEVQRLLDVYARLA